MYRTARASLLRRAFVFAIALLWPALGFGQPLRIAVISDLNGSYGSVSYADRVDQAIARIIELHPDLVLSTGDMVAGQRRNPKLGRSELAAMWDAFHRKVTRPLAEAGIPLAVTPGNHDASAYGGFALEREEYAREWENPPDVEMVDRGSYPFAYAFRVHDVLFVSLDATTVGALPEAQFQWLEQVLSRSSGNYRARVVFSHLPLWAFAQGRETEIIGDPRLAELFGKFDVDLHLSGHHHAYYPGAAGGMLYVSQACLGDGPRALIGTTERSSHSFTIVEVADDGGIDVHALEGPGYTERVDHSRLPPQIATSRITLRRADLSQDGS